MRADSVNLKVKAFNKHNSFSIVKSFEIGNVSYHHRYCHVKEPEQS